LTCLILKNLKGGCESYAFAYCLITVYILYTDFTDEDLRPKLPYITPKTTLYYAQNYPILRPKLPYGLRPKLPYGLRPKLPYDLRLLVHIQLRLLLHYYIRLL